MTLDEALHYIHSVCWKGSVPGLERISALLDKMGHPERKLKFIHVTGTNGKGSTCAMLASMFTKAGYKTGLYTSPYLIRFNERIQIDGVQIPDEEICEITEYIKPLADSIFEQPTEFEMVTALGFEYFARHNCDLVVCEVGMGGEFDATNVILPPEVAIICNIGLDHTEVLGDTLEKIAATKSGIIKPGCDAVIYREKPSVEAVIEARCKAVGAKLHKADFADIRLIFHDLTGQVFDWERFHALKAIISCTTLRSPSPRRPSCSSAAGTSRTNRFAKDLRTSAGRAGSTYGARTRCSSSTADTTRSAFRRSSRTFRTIWPAGR